MENTFEILKEKLSNFIQSNKISNNMFFLANTSNQNVDKDDRMRINGTKNLKRLNYTYTIQYFKHYDVVCIWNNIFTPSFSYSYKMIEDKLKNGFYFSDKGTENHSKNQQVIYFGSPNDYEKILSLASGKLSK